MVHRAIDDDPLATELLETLPKPLHKRLTPAVAGEAIVRGIEERRPRIIGPRRWTAMSMLRGVLNPLLDRLRGARRRDAGRLAKLDARAGEDQPTTTEATAGG